MTVTELEINIRQPGSWPLRIKPPCPPTNNLNVIIIILFKQNYNIAALHSSIVKYKVVSFVINSFNAIINCRLFIKWLENEKKVLKKNEKKRKSSKKRKERVAS